MVKTGYERPKSERQWESRRWGSRDQMWSVERARKAVTEKSEVSGGEGRGLAGVLGSAVEEGWERKERTEARVRRRRGAAEEEAERREEGVEEEDGEAVVEARREVVGSRWLWS